MNQHHVNVIHMHISFGNIYYKGQGVPKNKEKGIQYYEYAAKLNNSDAMMILGDFYLNGVNVKKDFDKGII